MLHDCRPGWALPLLLLTLCGAAFAILGDEILTLIPIADTTLFQTLPGNNLGALDTFIAGNTAVGLSNRALIRFDVAGQLPQNATIQSVSLALTVSRATADASNVFRLHRMLRDWTEGTGSGSNIGFPALVYEATLSCLLFPDIPWSSPGAGPPEDYVEEASCETEIGNSGTPEFPSTSGLISDVERWRTNTSENFGWILICADEAALRTARRFASRETVTNPPVLIIRYLLPERLSVELSPSADTALFQYRPDNNFGASELAAGSIGIETNRSRALLKFEVTNAIPPDAVLTGARLRLRVTRTPGVVETGSRFELHRVLKDWGEGNKIGTLGDLAEDGEATWFARHHPDVLWSVPGAAAPDDYSPTIESTQFIDSFGWYQFDHLAASVKFWQEHPSDNHGWILISGSEDVPRSARRFAPRESGAEYPVLQLDYVPMPHIDRFELSNGFVELTFDQLARNAYAIEGTADPSPDGWMTLTNLPPQAVSGAISVRLKATSISSFYRVKLTL